MARSKKSKRAGLAMRKEQSKTQTTFHRDSSFEPPVKVIKMKVPKDISLGKRTMKVKNGSQE